MERESFRRLNEFGLRTPSSYSLDKAAVAPAMKRFVLRYDKRDGRKNRIMSAVQVAESFEELKAEVDRAELLSIEDQYDTIVGGASLCKGEFSYSEIVSGNAVSLLRRGVCGARILHSRSAMHVRPVFQGWDVPQNGSDGWRPTAGVRADDCRDVCANLDSCLEKVTDVSLLEWMWTTDGLLFYDLKTSGFDSFGDSLEALADNREIVVQKDDSGNPIARCVVDGFDIDHRERPDENVELFAYNGAILSHFVTACRQRPITIRLAAYNEM